MRCVPGREARNGMTRCRHLRQQGADGADEHRLLIDARENLESGKEYRSVRAGPGFTRKLMGEIENDAREADAQRHAVPTATIVAIVCGLLILSTHRLMSVYRLAPRIRTPGQAAIEDLAGQSQRLFDTLATATFSGAIPEGWKPIGRLPLDAPAASVPRRLQSEAQNQKPGRRRGLDNGSLPGRSSPLPSMSPDRTDQPTAAVLLEAFVSTDPNFSPDKGTSSRDLVWQFAPATSRSC